MKCNYLYCVLIVLFFSCSSHHGNSEIMKIGGKNEAIVSIIEDFSKTEKGKKNKAYYVFENADSEDVYSFSFFDEYINYVNARDTIGAQAKYFPTRFKEINGRLYIWDDPTLKISRDIISIMHKYKVIDSTIYKIEKGELTDEATPLFRTDDSKKYIFYYVCKNNSLNFKKITSNRNLKLSQYPNFLCNKNK